MTAKVSGAIEYARQHGTRFLDELFEMLRIPSVGADPAFAADTRRNAEWLAAHLAALGLDKACVMETAGYPVVYGEWLGAGPDQPTVLVYGHYDVVPAVKEDGWDTPHFRAGGQEWHDLRPRGHRRQGAALHPDQGARIVSEIGRRCAGQREDPAGRRGGGVLAEHCALG